MLKAFRIAKRFVTALALIATLSNLEPGLSFANPGPDPTGSPLYPIQGGYAFDLGCLDIPSSVTGGCKGAGSLNVAKLYIEGLSIDFNSQVAAAISQPPNAAGGLLLYSTIPVSIGGTGLQSLTQNAPMFGNGTGPIQFGTTSGSTAELATVNGTLSPGHCVSIDSLHNFIDAGAACGSGGGGGSGIVASGAAGNVAIYATSGTTVSGLTNGTSSQVLIGGSAPTWGSVALSSMVSGTLQAAQEPAHSGDMTNTAGSLTTAVNSIGGRSVVLGGSLTIGGAFSTTLNVSATTNLTLPSSGTVTALGNSVNGTGSFVLTNSPSIHTAALGTPTSIMLTNATNLPVSTGISGLGSGIAAALAQSPIGSGRIVLATAPTLTGMTVTGVFTATGLVTNADLVNPSLTVNGTSCILGTSCTVSTSAFNSAYISSRFSGAP